jgi:hypothetical protein
VRIRPSELPLLNILIAMLISPDFNGNLHIINNRQFYAVFSANCTGTKKGTGIFLTGIDAHDTDQTCQN